NHDRAPLFSRRVVGAAGDDRSADRVLELNHLHRYAEHLLYGEKDPSRGSAVRRDPSILHPTAPYDSGYGCFHFTLRAAGDAHDDRVDEAQRPVPVVLQEP